MADWADEKAKNLLANWDNASPNRTDFGELHELICDYLRGTAREARIDALEEAARIANDYYDPFDERNVGFEKDIAREIRSRKEKQP